MDTIKQAQEIAEKILEMTKELQLTGEKENEEVEVLAYTFLMDERELLVDELTDLRQQIDETETASPEFAKVNEIISEIMALDKKNTEIIGKMREAVQMSYKEIKQGQRIQAGYNAYSNDEASSSTINIKQ